MGLYFEAIVTSLFMYQDIIHALQVESEIKQTIMDKSILFHA